MNVPQPTVPAENEEEPMQRMERRGRKLTLFMFSVLLVLGLFACYGFLVNPTIKSLQASDWVRTPCNILSSEVGTYSGGDTTTYSPNITFEYSFHGSRYESNRYYLTNFSSSDEEESAVIVREYPPGMQTVCYVDPKAPSNAALTKKAGISMLAALVALIFLASGAGGIILYRQKSIADCRPVRPQVPKILKAKRSPLFIFLLNLAMAAVWNGFVWFFADDLAEVLNNPTWPDILFLLFPLLGLALLLSAFICLLSLFNPRVRLVLCAEPLLGKAVDIEWSLVGNIRRVQAMRFTLEATQVRVTNNSETEFKKETLTKQVFYETSDLWEIADGSRVRFTIPDECQPTSIAKGIAWKIPVEGVTAPKWLWPNILEEFEIVVSA